MGEQGRVENGLSLELATAIDRASARPARQFAWELRLQRWRDTALVLTGPRRPFGYNSLHHRSQHGTRSVLGL
jgi:hypothetical protein